MDGSQLKSSEIGQLVAGLAVIAAFLIWLLATILTGIISFFSHDWGCYACGWRGRRRQIYRPEGLKAGLSGLPSFLVSQTIGPFLLLAGVLMRLRSSLNCPECGSINVRALDEGAPTLPPPRKTRAARAFLQGLRKPADAAAPFKKKRRASIATEDEPKTLTVRCNHCEQELEIPFDGGALAPESCPRCGAAPFEFEVE